MPARLTTDPKEFRATVFPFLQRDPVLNAVILEDVHQLVERGATATCVSLHGSSGEVVGAVLHTDRRGINLGPLPAQLVPGAVEILSTVVPEAAAVEGINAASFADHWSVALGKETVELSGVRLYRLVELEQVVVSGKPRRATPADLDLCTRWIADMIQEEGKSAAPAEDWVRTQTQAGRLWLAEHDGVPVSLVSHRATLLGVTRIGPVYTPPEFRRQGYGTTLTAHVSAVLRDAGSDVCLRTELTNVGSQRVYSAIGYEPVADIARYEFG